MKNSTSLEGLLKKDKYQVLLLVCPATLPFSFASHPWFVVNNMGSVSRFAVSYRKVNSKKRFIFGSHRCTVCRGHLHKDWRPPLEGVDIFPFSRRYLWKAKVIGVVEGDDDSLACKMVKFIEESIGTYPYAEKYSLIGDNSNTYAQWIINEFPECKFQLPWNSFGRNHRS